VKKYTGSQPPDSNLNKKPHNYHSMSFPHNSHISDSNNKHNNNKSCSEWLERESFYLSALPTDSSMEAAMVKAALEASRLEQREAELERQMYVQILSINMNFVFIYYK
jgi:hypothetical protein